MNYKKFSRIYSISRVSRYQKAANGNKKKAMAMYYANARMAQAFQPLISFFEVVLRNQLHYALAHHFNDVQWLVNQKNSFMSDVSLTHTVKKTGKLKVNDFLKSEVERSERTLIGKKRNVTAGRVIAELNFGFWNSLYETHHYALLKGVPCTIFKILPAGVGRKEVNQMVKQIRDLRNRISHNEPLCFNNKAFDMTYASDMYVMIRDFLNWIDPQIVTSLCKERLDCVEAEIKRTEKIINS
jgi:hypothetical protein